MKLSHVLQKLLTNKIVLNVVCALSAFNMIGYLVLGKLTAILFFIVLAILITHFSKNMIVVLGVPLILVNFLVLTGIFNTIEGAETMSGDKGTQAQAKASTAKSKETPEQQAKIKADKEKIQNDKNGAQPSNTEESFEVGRAKRRGAGSQIDYAATIEGAYDDLNNILGSDGIKKLTDDTQRLMKQQMQLAASMKDMGPMIKGLEPMMNQAKAMMSTIGDDSGGGEGISSIMDMVKKIGGVKAQPSIQE